MCVYVLRNGIHVGCTRKTGLLTYRVLNFICHTNRDCLASMTDQHVYKELLNLKKQL